MLTVNMMILSAHSQEYLMQDISQECWQDCTHENDRIMPQECSQYLE